MKYIARSASDKTDDWPYWMVWDRQRGLNVTGRVMIALNIPWKYGAVFTSRQAAEKVAELANEQKVEL